MRSAKKYLEIVLCVFALALSILSTAHCIKKLAYIEHLADASTTPQLNTDANFYVGAAQRYQLTGQLYNRPAEGETFTSTYYPMAPVFKFPPAFQLQILPIVNNWTPNTIKLLKFAMIIGYFSACLALMTKLSLMLHRQGHSHTKVFLFFTVTSIMATANPAFWDCIISVSYEIPIFFLLTVSFFLLEKHPKVSAGIIGYLAAIKIYPAFMASLLLITPTRKRAITAFILSALLFCSLAFFIFGWQENIFYIQNILPVLSNEKVAPVQFSLSFGSELFRLTQNIELARAAFQVLRLTLLIVSFFILFKYRETRQEINFFALLMVLMLICLPNYWICYLIMLFPAFCVAIHRVITRPSITGIIILLLCISATITESQSWMHLNAPAWLTDTARMDATGEKITAAIHQESWTQACLIFLRHYPLTMALFLLEQMKFLVPIALCFFVMREILSTGTQHTCAPHIQPTSSNPER